MIDKSLQASEIMAICQRLRLTPAQLAERVPMKAETMRKVMRDRVRAFFGLGA